MMEKRGVIQPGLTPPERPATGVKQAADLADHTTRRLADHAADKIAQAKPAVTGRHDPK